ncbi:hypothetical protein KUTeg_023106 [Tegillarca granosa]|uniref:C-type lectin domain-containing protein n=1 Tax=Tegillarca granosa TaxID=220873 RepID=A0ABQ9E0P3_TEGGR|nr:hypothetical protein KUTeg_023106 [Tegillarca granosa]
MFMKYGTWVWMLRKDMDTGLEDQILRAIRETGNPSDSYHYEDCVHLNPKVDFQWNDVSCSTQAYYICEKP